MERVNREQMLHVLESVQVGLSRQAVIDQASCFAFRKGRVYTFNDEAAGRAAFPFVKLEGAIKAEPLLEILRKLEEEEVEIGPVKGSLLIKGKHSKKIRLRIEEEIQLPYDCVEAVGTWKELPADFCEAVGVIQACAGKDESDFLFTCVHIHNRWIEACDNMQVCRWKMMTGFARPALVRRKAIKDVVNMGVHEFSETENWIHFRNRTGVVLSCRRYNDAYEDISPVLKVQGESLVLPKSLTGVVDRAEIFSKQNPEINRIEVNLVPSKIKITSIGDGTHYYESRKVSYEGPPLKFQIVPQILADVVKRFSQCTIGPDKLKAVTEKYKYVTVLLTPADLDDTDGVVSEGENNDG